MADNYSIFKRSGRKYYYCQFKLADGTYGPARSTGKTTKGKAREWAIQQINEGKVKPPDKTTFGTFAENFFDYNGPWAIDKRARGLRIGKRHCMERADLLKNSVMPYFKDYKLTEINRAAIKEYRTFLFNEGYRPSTINKRLSCLKTILESAEDAELITAIPRFDRAAGTGKRKGILTIDETITLFNHEWTMKEAVNHPVRTNFIGKAANRLAACTGLRASEIQGLTHADIDFEKGFLMIRRSWDTRIKQWNETTKNQVERKIFIPAIVQDELKQLMYIHPAPGPDAPIFFSERIPEQPTAQRVFSDALYKALHEIGIDEAQRKERNISFHSWRGFMNSLMINSQIPLQKIMRITGHQSNKMVEHYYTVDDMQDIKQLQESLFAGDTEPPGDVN